MLFVNTLLYFEEQNWHERYGAAVAKFLYKKIL